MSMYLHDFIVGSHQFSLFYYSMFIVVNECRDDAMFLVFFHFV